ncbi:transposase [Patescibacteria group bacterium]|nr:transposase [Patescibacteria group bacterium]
MARPLRVTVENYPFHIINRGNNRQAIFLGQEDFLYLLKLLKRYKKELKFKLYHFCLMPNHIHLVIEPTLEGSLPKIIMRVSLAYSTYFNKKYKGVGHVWQGRYKSSLIDKENYFLHCGLYVELNPVRAGLAEKPENWQWSSYKFYAFGDDNALIEDILDEDPFYIESGKSPEERREFYRQSVEELMGEEFLKNIRRQLNEGVFGRKEFVQEMKEKFKIRALRGRGRPRRE